MGSTILGILLLVGVMIPLTGCTLKRDLLITRTNLNQKISAQTKETKKIKADLETQLKEWKTVKKKIYATQAELRSSLRELREDLRNLQGRLEENIHLSEMSAKKNNELDKTTQTLTKRIVHIEAYLGMEPTESKIPSAGKVVKPRDDQPPKKLTGDELYVAAKKLFDEGNYDAAREQFQTFCNENPKSAKADNAQFWIGETYYHEKWYEKAIIEYQKVIEKYPDGNKAPSALLKQGLAFYNIDDKGNARLILKELIRKFPQSKEAQIAEKKLSGMN